MLDMLKKLSKLNCKTLSTPINTWEKVCMNDGTSKIDERFFRKIVGGLIYLTHTRLETMFYVSMISRFMHCPSHHLGVINRILKYIYGT